MRGKMIVFCVITLVLIVGCVKKDDENKDNSYKLYYMTNGISLDSGLNYQFSDDLIAVKKNDKYGYMNRKGEIEIEPVYDSLFQFSEGMARVQLDNKWGYINLNGEVVVSLDYWYANDFSEGYGHICMSESDLQNPCIDSGIVDKTGNLVIDSRNYDYQIIGNVKSGLISVKKDNKYGFIDIEGNVVIDFLYKNVSDFVNDYAVVVTMEDKKLLIGKDGEYVLDLTEYENAYIMDEDIIAVTLNDKIGFINFSGDTIADFKYELTNSASEGKIVVKEDEVYKILNVKDNTVLDLPDYSMVSKISEGLLAVRENDKWGFIDTFGNVVVRPQYDSFYDFNDGLAYVKKGNSEMFIDKKGNVILKDNN